MQDIDWYRTARATRHLAYERLLGRPIDAEGDAYLTYRQREAQWTAEDIKAWLRASMEYTEKHQTRSGRGAVRLQGRAFADDGGAFLGFGASLFAALWFARHDRVRLQRNLSWLADRGVNYVRILTMVGNLPYWHGRVVNPNWDGYFATFDDLFVDAAARGVRLNVVLFADTDTMMPLQADRRTWVTMMAAYLTEHRDQVQFVEIANESNHNGVDDRDLAELTRLWMANSDILVAPSSPDGDFRPEEAFNRLFREQDLRPDLLTPHFERRTNTVETVYRPHRQPWEVQGYKAPTTVFVSDEPIGPGSSGQSEKDPARMAIGMATTFIAGGAGFVLHSKAGVRGDVDFAAVPGLAPIMTALRGVTELLPPDIANGRRQNHHWAGHPYLTDDQIWPDHPNTGGGVVRAYASEIDRVFFVAVMGLKNNYTVTAKWPMTVEVFSARDATIRLEAVELGQGQTWTFRQHGELRDFIHRITRR